MHLKALKQDPNRSMEAILINTTPYITYYCNIYWYKY